MTIEIKPETEQLVREELGSGYFQSVDELITQAVQAWRERSTPRPVVTRKKLVDVLCQPPFAGSELNLERRKEYPGPIDS